MKFHHFGLALNDFRRAVSFYESLNYECSEPVIDPLQQVELVLCKSKSQPWVELIKPINQSSPINNYLEKNNEIIYHTSYEVDNVEDALKNYFAGFKYKCISKPKPAVLFNNRLVSFYYFKGIGIIEFLER
jgi:methylmalonyl-CoA/ethylmalonyl-CoA epimerase